MVQLESHRDRTSSRSLPLTRAESRVLDLLPTHLTIQAIAEQLECKRSTAKTHVAHIYEKLGATTRGEAVARAREAGLLANPVDVDETASGARKERP